AGLAASLDKRVTNEVNRAGGPAAGGGGAGTRPCHHRSGARRPSAPAPGRGSPAASYLGLSPARLRADLAAGMTLAQIADATPGKSTRGLIDALIASRRARLAAAVASGRLSAAHAPLLVPKRGTRGT